MADLGILRVFFKDYTATLHQTSFDEEKQEYLCNSKEQDGVYCFDKYVKEKYAIKPPRSFDALVFPKNHTNAVVCIEFKNQILSEIDMKQIFEKYEQGFSELSKIFHEHNIPVGIYSFDFFLVCRNSKGEENTATSKGRFRNKTEKEYRLRAWVENHSNKMIRSSIPQILRLQDTLPYHRAYFDSEC